MRTHASLRIAIAALVITTPMMPLLAQTVQEHVHAASHGVMPFDMSKTVHIFKMTEEGGVESVVIKDPATTNQLPLIQDHLRHEANQFQKGNYFDPSTLHGTDMPGLAELQKGASQVKVSYANLPNGGAITFATTDARLLTAIHRWFGAQLSEHGSDARAE
jgi:hypothetical protein